MEKFCPECNAPVDEGAKVCPECGAALDGAEAPSKKPRKKSARQLMKEGETIGKSVVLCSDGKYRWRYDMSLFKNPTIFLLVWKIFFFILIGIFAVVFLASLGSPNFFFEGFLEWLKALGIALGVMSVVVLLGYLLYAAMMGGKYCVIFEMDEKGVNHKQTADQAKKARKISKATIGAGLATGRLTTIGIGINSARTEMYSDFDRVRKIKAYPKTNVIKVNGRLSHNQVYAEKEDFDFVKNYIVEHCKNAKPQKTYGKMT